MKIIASFDSADTADFTAGAIKRAVSPLSSAEAREIPPLPGNLGLNVFTAFNVVSTTPTYSMPVYNPTAFDITADEHASDYTHSDHIVEVVCRKEEYPAVSKIIIAHGGRNITKL